MKEKTAEYEEKSPAQSLYNGDVTGARAKRSGNFYVYGFYALFLWYIFLISAGVNLSSVLLGQRRIECVKRKHVLDF